MSRTASSVVIRTLLGAVLALWLGAQTAGLVHQLDAQPHPAGCDECLTHASLGHALGAAPPAALVLSAAVLILAVRWTCVTRRFVPVYRGRAPPR